MEEEQYPCEVCGKVIEPARQSWMICDECGGVFCGEHALGDDGDICPLCKKTYDTYG